MKLEPRTFSDMNLRASRFVIGVMAWLLPTITVLALASCEGEILESDPSLTTPSRSTSVLTTAEKALDTQGTVLDSPSANGTKNDRFDDFINHSYRQLLSRDPELVTSLGLQDAFEMGDDELTDISPGYSAETINLQRAILDELRTFDRNDLEKDQQLTYDIYAWYLEDLVRGGSFPYHDFPLTHYFTAEHNQIIHFFTEIHPISNVADAENYITRLSKIASKFRQLEEVLRLRQEAGIIPPRYIVERAGDQIGRIAHGEAVSTPFYSVFAEKIEELDGLSDSDRQSLLKTAEAIIEDSVIPAYLSLEGYLSELEQIAPQEIGVGTLPEGDSYYSQLLRHYTTTDLTADEIHQSGIQQLERIQREMRSLFSALEYSEDETIPQLYSRVARDGGTVPRAEVVPAYERIIAEAAASLEGISSLRPSAEIIVKGVPSGGYYVAPAFDGSRPGAFYATASGPLSRFAMPTLAYHEGIPGHHFQIAVAQDLDLSLFRNTVKFGAYVEGWALYAERLAWENGLYDDDPFGDLGRLQAEAFRAARLVVDTGIHARGWTRDRAIQFMESNTGLSRNMVASQIDRYVAWPGQATSYSIGMLKILELRGRAAEQLGDLFDHVVFNDFILSRGSLPLVELDDLVDEFISEQLNG
ncbi:MAG: DUF885 domain-containing protein [Candidatus Promineifilaceae bacterium]